MRSLPAGKIAIGSFIVLVIILGIAFFGSDGTGTERTSPEAEAPTSPSTQTTLPSEPQYNWEISGLIYRITEQNEVWWKFAWQATLKNNTSHYVDFFVDVRFLDADGFIVDDDMENPSTFAPNEQRGISGYALIDAEIAPDVKDIDAEVTAYIAD